LPYSRAAGRRTAQFAALYRTAQTGLMRRALQALDMGLGDPDDPCVRLRLLLSLLGAERQQVRQRVFQSRHWSQIEPCYRGDIGWRPARLCHLMWVFIERARLEPKGEKALCDFMRRYAGGSEADIEPWHQELLALLDEEIAEAQEEFQHEVEAQEERDAIERDACLAPAAETWETLLREEAALDRAIDRKVRIILTMRKEHARRLREEAGPPEDEGVARTPALGVRGSSVPAAAPCHHTNEEPQTANPAVCATPQADENAEETTKSPEQSENVIENKATAPEEVIA